MNITVRILIVLIASQGRSCKSIMNFCGMPAPQMMEMAAGKVLLGQVNNSNPKLRWRCRVILIKVEVEASGENASDYAYTA